MAQVKWVCAGLVALVISSGPLGPLGTWAQTAADPSTTMQPIPPPPPGTPPPGPVAPRGTSTSGQSGPVVPIPMQPEAVEAVHEPPSRGARIGAGVLNVVYVPGKAIICGAGTLIAGGFMLLTFGSAYREAVSFFNEGCGGSWVLTPEEVAAAPKTTQLDY